MNKNMKWMIISVSTATTLLFGGLVANNQIASNNINNTDEDNSSSSNDNQLSTGDLFYEGKNNDLNSDLRNFNPDSSDSYSNWGQDQFRQTPSNGFEQQHGSSGTSK